MTSSGVFRLTMISFNTAATQDAGYGLWFRGVEDLLGGTLVHVHAICWIRRRNMYIYIYMYLYNEIII